MGPRNEAYRPSSKEPYSHDAAFYAMKGAEKCQCFVDFVWTATRGVGYFFFFTLGLGAYFLFALARVFSPCLSLGRPQPQVAHIQL